MRRWVRQRVAIVLLGISASAAAHAQEEPEQVCLAAYEDGQRLRQRGDLVRARDALFRCAAETCPAPVRADCSEWSAELERQIPTIVISARRDDGSDIARARVRIDDVVVAERLDGRPLPLNPGEHAIGVEVEGRSVKQHVIVNQGEKARLVRFSLERTKLATTPPAPPPSVEPPAKAKPGPLPYILAGTGLVAVAGFAYFAIRGTRRASDLRDTCAPACTEESLDSVKRDLLVADILLGVSVIAAGSSAVLFVVGSPDANSGGLMLRASGSF